MDQLRWHDLSWCLRRCPRKVLQALKDQPGQVVVSGGFIRDCVSGDKVNDVDLFVTSKNVAKPLAWKIGDTSKPHETENAYTVRNVQGLTCQVIHRWTFGLPEALVESFDFTVAKAAFWWDDKFAPHCTPNWNSICHPDFYADLAARRLIYVSPVREEEPGGSLLRVLKFYQRGYRIPLDSLGAVLARLVMKVDLPKGVSWGAHGEKQWAKVLTGLLRDVDPDIDPTHAAHLPSGSSDDDAKWYG
jgi:hypothetical protein